VVDAPRKYHKPLTNTVSYGQSLTVENGPYAALIYIWPGRAGRPLFIFFAKVRVASQIAEYLSASQQPIIGSGRCSGATCDPLCASGMLPSAPLEEERFMS
jgi:hypothetical protein